MKPAPILLACLAGVAIFTLPACGRAANPDSSADPRSQQQREQAEQYFERVLEESGTDLETRVGEYLNVLELDVRQLQAMPIDQAYRRAHDAAMRFPDEDVRRQMLLSLFDEKKGQ